MDYMIRHMQVILVFFSANVIQQTKKCRPTVDLGLYTVVHAKNAMFHTTLVMLIKVMLLLNIKLTISDRYN